MSDETRDSTIDEIKGRAKEAAGAVTDDDALRREGRADQASAEVNRRLDATVDKARDTLDDARDKAEHVVDEVKKKVGTEKRDPTHG